VIQTLALEQFHGNEVLTLMFADFEYGADAGVAQGRRCARLPLQAVERRGILLELIWQKLQCHAAAQLEIFGGIHHTHAAAPQQTENPVV